MEPDANTSTTIDEYLDLVRGGIRLPSSIKEKTSTYITNTLAISSGEEVQDLGADMFLEVVEAAWGAEVPEPLSKMLRKWFESPVTKAKAISLKESATPTPKDEGAFFDAFLGEGAASGVNTDLESDMKAMNLSGAQIKALALSIETGQVHTEYDVIDMTYGADPRLCDIAKQRRKTGLESLSKILDAKDVRAMNVHFATLIRDLNAEGKTSEVSVITAWLMESQEVFANDEAAMISYVRAYLRRFRGRAFPQKFEFALFAKSITSSVRSGGLSDDQKETLKAAKKAAQEMEALKQRVTSMADQIKTLKNASSNQGGPAKNACHYCGMLGHIATNCKLNPNSDKYDEKFAKKQAGALAKKKDADATEDDE